MRYFKFLVAAMMAAACLQSCQEKPGQKEDEGLTMKSVARVSYSKTKPEKGAKGDFSVTTDKMMLYSKYHGTNDSDDVLHFNVNFPSDHKKYRAAYLSYTMCAEGKGPADWDQTTIVSIKNKKTGEWYEFARAFTPYGGSFSANWNMTWYMDVTEFLPFLEGDTEFTLYYCGWEGQDASKHHAVKLGFDLFEGTPEKNVIFTKKIYDTCEGSTPGYRRCWPYGIQGWSIEDPARLGERIIDIPAGVKSALVRVDITGHGMDYDGHFLNRPGYTVNSCAEFDYQNYYIKLNGEQIKEHGKVFEANSDNYEQAGTWYYDRAGWGPGKPANVQWWEIRNIPAEGARISLDFDFDEFQSSFTSPNEDSNPYYIISTDLFGYDK